MVTNRPPSQQGPQRLSVPQVSLAGSRHDCTRPGGRDDRAVVDLTAGRSPSDASSGVVVVPGRQNRLRTTTSAIDPRGFHTSSENHHNSVVAHGTWQVRSETGSWCPATSLRNSRRATTRAVSGACRSTNWPLDSTRASAKVGHSLGVPQAVVPQRQSRTSISNAWRGPPAEALASATRRRSRRIARRTVREPTCRGP